MKKKLAYSSFIFVPVILLCFAAVSDINSITQKTDRITVNRIRPVKRTLSKEELIEEIEDLKARVEKLEHKSDERFGLKIGGAFDVSVSNYRNKPHVFELGDFELSLSHYYRNNFEVAALLVFNRGAELRVGFIDYHVFGGYVSPRGRLFEEEGVHIQIGKFDVPFGNDWQYFSSVDRTTITEPFTTVETMEGGYNDTGMRLLASFVSVNFSLYVLKGIEEKTSYGGSSFGGRLGLTPFSNPYMLKSKALPALEIGGSYIHDIDSAGKSSERAFAVDFLTNIGVINIRAEYYNRNKLAGVKSSGYHITSFIDLQKMEYAPLKIFFRYDAFKLTVNEIPSDEESLSRISGGININISDISYLKFEYQRYISGSAKSKSDQYFNINLFYAQLVIRF